jgi:hypothetical protein
MGTDIHMQVQGRRADGTWEFIKRAPFARYGDPDFDWGTDPTQRNYDVFALLADVRNGSGFAGVYRHEPVHPQFPDRGFPEGYEDPSPEGDEDDPEYAAWRKEFKAGDFWWGDHSATWATMAELLQVPWEVEYKSGGVVAVESFKVWQKKGIPDSWSGGISGPGIITHKDPEEYARMIAAGEIRYRDGGGAFDGGCLDYCFVTWAWQPVKECAFRTWIEGPTMASIAEEYGGPENVRVIMGFDS